MEQSTPVMPSLLAERAVRAVGEAVEHEYRRRGASGTQRRVLG